MNIKSVILGAAFLTATAASAQSDPTIESYATDTVCEDSYGRAVYDLVIEDLDNDSTYINVEVYDNILIYSVDVVAPPTYDPGESQRVFQLYIYTNYGIPAGVTLTDITIQVSGGGAVVEETLVGIGLRSNPVVTADFSSQVFCSNGNPVDAAPFVDPDGGYLSYNDGTESPFFDPEIYYNDPGDGIVYSYTDAYGCTNDAMTWVGVANAPSVSMVANSSSCGNADGSAVATILGDATPFQANWTTGFSESTSWSSTINNLSSGNYYLNVVDNNGCKAVGIAQVTDGDLDITASVTDETCIHQSFDGAIDLDVLSTNGTVDYIFWNNGASTEDISGIKAGEYTAQVHTTTGCQGSFTFVVGSLPKLEVDVDGYYYADCTLPNGGSSGIEISSYGGSGDYSWEWNTGITTEDIYNIPAGIYTCEITDNITGCTWTWSTNLDAFNGPNVYIENMTQADCNQLTGAVDMSIYSPTPIISTSWSSGQLTEDLTNVPAGTYTLTAIDINGCTGQKQVEITNKKPYQPGICLLTVDTSLVFNMVVWEKDLSQDIAGFNIYRETPTFGIFEQVESRPFALESFYQDNIASPMDRSWRYYITTFDECGGESFPSFIHKTIHVVATTSDGTNYDLHWDDYEGISYSSVDLHRYDPTNGWETIETGLPYGTNTYADVPPVVTGLDYLVTFNLTDPCTSTKVQDHNSSRSNKSASVFMPGGSTAQIQDEELGYISIYPNPASAMITLHVDKPELFQVYEVRDLNGQLVSTGAIFTNNTFIDLTELAAGVYTIHLVSDSKIVVEKFVKQ